MHNCTATNFKVQIILSVFTNTPKWPQIESTMLAVSCNCAPTTAWLNYKYATFAGTLSIVGPIWDYLGHLGVFMNTDNIIWTLKLVVVQLCIP